MSCADLWRLSWPVRTLALMIVRRLVGVLVCGRHRKAKVVEIAVWVDAKPRQFVLNGQ
jgi:hypothetical protein